MVASKLRKYLNCEDKNRVKVASWALETDLASVAKCKHCQCPVKFTSGKAMLLSHSESGKHISNTSKCSSTQIQMNIAECLSNAATNDSDEQELRRRTEEFEISLARSLSNHKVSMQFVECLQSQLKKYCGDSKIVDMMSIQRRKGETLVRHGIGPGYQQETIKLMQEADCFSIGFDESEVNKTSELEVLVNVSTKDSVELRHYRTLDLLSGTAETIVKTLLSQFNEDCIDYRKKMFCSMTDGCNTMQGQHKGVKKLLSKEIPQYVDLGSCNDHHLSNALKAAVTEFDPDIQQALVNVYMDIGGAKGKGLKKKKEFEKVCQSIGLKTQKLKKFSSTRFRGIRNCLKPVLHNWNGIVKYYEGLKKPTERQEQLKAYFVDREWLSLLNMTFVMAASRELNEAIDYFEQRKTLIHFAREKMEQILRSQVLKFMDDTSVKKLADDSETVEPITGADLLSIDIDDKERTLSKRKVFVGQETSDLILSYELEPKSKQLGKFYENVYRYHRTVTLRLMKYFDTGLKCTELLYISAFAPKKYNALSTSLYMKYLVEKFSKIVNNIEPVDGVDMIKEEIDNYTMDEEISLLSNEPFEEFWLKVGALNEGNWTKYPLLPRFAFALSTAFNSNSEAERAFSVQTDIHRNTKRSLMMQETFDSHMQIHYGVECKASKDICELCIKHKEASSKDNESMPRQHCHCSVAPISDAMKEQCRRKWSVEKTRQTLNAAINAESADADKSKSSQAKEESSTRKKNFISTLKGRTTFYRPDLMTRVFKSEALAKKDSQGINKADSSSSSSSKSNTCNSKSNNSSEKSAASKGNATLKASLSKSSTSVSSKETAPSPSISSKPPTVSSKQDNDLSGTKRKAVGKSKTSKKMKLVAGATITW